MKENGENKLRWIAILPASLVICFLSEIILNLVFTLQNWICCKFFSYELWLCVEDVRTSIVHNILVGLGATYFSCCIAVAIAPNHKKIAGIFCSSFFAVIYLLASISYGGVVWCQFIGSLIVIAIMTYRNEVIMREKIKYFLLVTAGIIFLIWCCRDIFFWKPEPKPLMSPKSINFDTNVPLKKYKNEIFSFLYPSNWKIEEYMEGQIEVLCKEEETDSTGFDTYIVVMTKTTVSANDILQANIAELKTDSFSYTVTLGDVFESQFNGRPSVCIDYESSFKDSFNGVFYNRLTVFKVGGYAVIMGKRAIEKSDLDTKFKIMEDSFSIDKKR